jgi:hypothetical protein
MKRASLAVVAAVAVMLSGSASAQSTQPIPLPCVKGTLASYIALGARGCSIGNTVFANFSYMSASTVPPPDGVTVIPTSQLVPTPQPLYPGFTFQASWVAKAGQTVTSAIGYTVTPAGPTMGPITSPLPAGLLKLQLGAAQVFNILGSVTVQEDTSVGSLSVYERCTEVCTIKESDQLIYSPLQAIKVASTVTLVGGNGGAMLNGFTQTFGPAPTL